VVEDEPRLRQLLLEIVPEMGFAARAARSAEEALELLRQEPAEVLLLDHHLPGMSGLELLEKLRESAGSEDRTHPQAIVMTAFGDLETARRAIRAEVVDFLTKPAPLGEIEAALERARRRYVQDLPPPAAPTPPPTDTDPPGTLADAERHQILSTLARHDGNRTATAIELGISRRTLHYKLALYRDQGYDFE
jgi:DNA-binding NtrC family response regulator